MEGFEIHSLDQRLGKFEGVQQQHDQRLADIERRLGVIEVLINEAIAEGHREREALRTELIGRIEATRTELTALNESTRAEINNKIDEVRTQLNSKIDEVRAEINGRLDKVDARIDRLSDKIDGLYKWIIGILIAVGTSVIASLLKGFFGG
jgi:predicted  nucleic acid-binding Zn-ribbon protein